MDTLAALAVTPAVYGESERPPRGDCSRAGTVHADYRQLEMLPDIDAGALLPREALIAA